MKPPKPRTNSTGGPNPHLYVQVQAQVYIKTGSFELTFCWKKPEKFLVPHGQIRPCVKWGVHRLFCRYGEPQMNPPIRRSELFCVE